MIRKRNCQINRKCIRHNNIRLIHCRSNSSCTNKFLVSLTGFTLSKTSWLFTQRRFNNSFWAKRDCEFNTEFLDLEKLNWTSCFLQTFYKICSSNFMLYLKIDMLLRYVKLIVEMISKTVTKDYALFTPS